MCYGYFTLSNIRKAHFTELLKFLEPLAYFAFNINPDLHILQLQNEVGIGGDVAMGYTIHGFFE